ncbi:rab9 and, putative [Pediculus humanus corporis]|uniref:small monomeric GTPase n=1 Tax=Pediculus humanus subsp. corporis TaxID=121224 RepID=E0VWV1_PEDHC|nr:rab9 and, putative [Pediculus humanus corporis]EEB17857.1 rab9 and, putative [Pediculus humanus corporis]
MSGKNAILKVVILGDGAVGKSCLMQRYVNNRFDENSFHTIGVEFLNKEIDLDDKTFILQIWDTAGQERFKSLRTPFYRGSDLCLLVFSFDDRESFENIEKWKNEFVHYADIKDPANFPFVIIGNKVDLVDEQRQISTEEAVSWCKNNGNLPYLETSAKESTNVENAFVTAVNIWSSLEEKLEKMYDGDAVTLSQNYESPKSVSCCSSNKS